MSTRVLRSHAKTKLTATTNFTSTKKPFSSSIKRTRRDDHVRLIKPHGRWGDDDSDSSDDEEADYQFDSSPSSEEEEEEEESMNRKQPKRKGTRRINYKEYESDDEECRVPQRKKRKPLFTLIPPPINATQNYIRNEKSKLGLFNTSTNTINTTCTNNINTTTWTTYSSSILSELFSESNDDSMSSSSSSCSSFTEHDNLPPTSLPSTPLQPDESIIISSTKSFKSPSSESSSLFLLIGQSCDSDEDEF